MPRTPGTRQPGIGPPQGGEDVLEANEVEQQGLPQPDPTLKRLDRFVGTWAMTGRTLGSDADNVSGRATFEWLPGGFFLQQRITLDTLKITVSYGPLDATFTGRWSEDGQSFGGGWRPNPGADATVNPPYDIRGSRAA